VTQAGDRGAIGFAEKVLELLEEGRYTPTYKYAVLLDGRDDSTPLDHLPRPDARNLRLALVRTVSYA
jgi:hypothetical protein